MMVRVETANSPLRRAGRRQRTSEGVDPRYLFSCVDACFFPSPHTHTHFVIEGRIKRFLACVSLQWDTAAAQQEEVDIANVNDPSRISKEALAKAQKMAAIQAKIALQMQSLGATAALPGIIPSVVPGIPGAVPGAFPAAVPLGVLQASIMGLAAGIPMQMMPAAQKKETFMPAPLILDDKGRHVDAAGKEVSLNPTTVTTVKANIREAEPAPAAPPAPKVDVTLIVDPRLSMSSSVRPKRATFSFVTDQRYMRKADRFRTKMAIAEFNNQLKKMSVVVPVV
jgi:hypothetical protein